MKVYGLGAAGTSEYIPLTAAPIDRLRNALSRSVSGTADWSDCNLPHNDWIEQARIILFAREMGWL